MKISKKSNVGHLVTWTVDYEESILKSKIKNPDLEIGISLDEKESPQGKMIYVHWFSEQKGGWAPVSSLRILQNYVKNN